jgi:ABC-2 type transport system permease protein
MATKGKAAVSLSLYGKYAGVSIRGQLQYPASFVIQSIGSLLITGIEFLAIAALFTRFGSLKGWKLGEMAVFYGMITIAFACCDSITKGFDSMDSLVKRGELDRILLRPRGTILQILGYEFTLRRIGRFSQGFAVLLYGFLSVPVHFSMGKVIVLVAAFSGSTLVFISLMLIHAALAFRTTETLEIMNTMTYGGIETAQYPISIFPEGMRRFFMFIIPLACVNYFPILLVLGKPDPLGSPRWFQAVSPAAGFIFFLAGVAVWRAGIRRYASTGS